MALLALLACTEGDRGPSATIGLLPIDPAVPLVAMVEVVSPISFRVTASWTDSDGDAHTASANGLAPGTTLVLAGFPPTEEVPIDVEVRSVRGALLARSQEVFEPGPMPADFPGILVDVSQPDRMEPGVTLLGVNTSGIHYVVLLDAAGTVRWIFDQGEDHFYQMVWDPGQRTITGVSSNGTLGRIDLAGRTQATWVPTGMRPVGETEIPVDADAFHHDLAIDAAGRFVALHHHVETMRFRTAYEDPAAHAEQAVWVDDIVRFDPDTGQVDRQIPLVEVLDPERLGYDSLDDVAGARDWTHCNALVPDADGGLMLSCRNQDALVHFDPQGDVDWIAGNPAGWPPDLDALRLAPIGDMSWFYHQHGPQWLDADRLILFDNGNWRASPGDGQLPVEAQNSRILALSVDTDARTIAQDWAWEPADGPLFSSAMGSARALPTTGNTLAAFGFDSRVQGVPLTDAGLGQHGIRAVEFDASGEVVWQVRVEAPVALAEDGWNTFRAERFTPPW
jgi:hypothetical protein